MRSNYTCATILVITLLMVNSNSVVAVYHCGAGAISTSISWLTAGACDRDKLSDQCCYPHDRCIDDANDVFNTSFYANYDKLVHREFLVRCDSAFRQCIRDTYSDRGMCRTWLEITHATVVTLYTKFKSLFE